MMTEYKVAVNANMSKILKKEKFPQEKEVSIYSH